jgi:hypothetical protein
MLSRIDLGVFLQQIEVNIINKQPSCICKTQYLKELCHEIEFKYMGKKEYF